MKRIYFIVVGFFIMTTGQVWAQSKVGTTGASFLGIAVGPRAIGSGGAFVARANDATALYWNNAGIAQLTRNEVMVSHNEWLAGTSFDYAAFVMRMGSGALGVSLTALSMDEMEVTTVLKPEGTGERFDAGYLMTGLTYAHAMTDRFYLGASIKYIHETIWKESTNGVAFDLGTLYQTRFFNGMRIGAVISNFGSSLKMQGDDLIVQHDTDGTSTGNNDNTLATMKTDKWNLPIFFRVGVATDAYKNADHRLTIATDALHPNDNEESLSIGGEYSYKEMLFLRAGLKSALIEDGEEGLTFGAGFQINEFGATQFCLDYAYQDFGRLGNPHTFGLSVRF